MLLSIAKKVLANQAKGDVNLHFEPNWNTSTLPSSQCSTAAQQTMAFAQTELGIGNRLQLLDDELLANLGDIQIRNALGPSVALVSGAFTLEMQTGTGKSYIYLRTIFE